MQSRRRKGLDRNDGAFGTFSDWGGPWSAAGCEMLPAELGAKPSPQDGAQDVHMLLLLFLAAVCIKAVLGETAPCFPPQRNLRGDEVFTPLAPLWFCSAHKGWGLAQRGWGRSAWQATQGAQMFSDPPLQTQLNVIWFWHRLFLSQVLSAFSWPCSRCR